MARLALTIAITGLIAIVLNHWQGAHASILGGSAHRSFASFVQHGHMHGHQIEHAHRFWPCRSLLTTRTDDGAPEFASTDHHDGNCCHDCDGEYALLAAAIGGGRESRRLGGTDDPGELIVGRATFVCSRDFWRTAEARPPPEVAACLLRQIRSVLLLV